MFVREITKQEELDAFIGSQAKSQFLQSWRWGEFRHLLAGNILRLGVFDGHELLGSAQIIQHSLPLGRKYWYCPRGPVVNNRLPIATFQAAFNMLLAEAFKRADSAGAMFLKVEPPLEKSSQQIFKSLIAGYQAAPARFVQPPDSWYLDLRQPAEVLLNNMHPKTRYNIRLAERKGVTVRTAGQIGDFDAFWQLMRVTAERDKFQAHSRQYYREMWRLLSPHNFMKMYLAEYQGRVIAGNLVAWFGDTVTYLHGASADQNREVMAPHLLQWRQIQEARQADCRYYDFWGILPSLQSTDYGLRREAKNNSWLGITRFKKGFGGFEINYLGAHDLIIDKIWYTIYKLAQKARIN